MIPPARLVDYFFALQLDPEASEEHQARVYYCYPPLQDGKDDTLRNIVPFCFPSGVEFPKNTSVAYHDFVLTDERGQKKFACCLKTRKIKMGPTTEDDEDEAVSCFCLVSCQPRFNTLRACLHAFYSLASEGKAEEFILRLMYQVF
jgi:hypothetical protein